MEFAVSLAFQDPLQAGALARAAEEAGFAAVVLSDHVVHPERIRTPYPYTPDGAPRWPPFTPWPDPWVTVGHLSALTTRIRFVTGIYVLPLRNPFAVAKAVGTAAVLSRDRVTLGIGAGWMREEFELLEQPFAARGRRMDEMLEVVAKLWSGRMVQHQGEFYRFEPLEMSPVPQAPVPIWCGGLSAPALRRAATRCDGWISDLHSIEELAGIVLRLRSMRDDSERAAIPFSVLAAARDAFDLAGYRRAAEAGVTHLMTMPWIFYGASGDALQPKLDGIRRFGEDVIAPLRDGEPGEPP